MATFCCAGVAAQKRLAMTSIQAEVAVVCTVFIINARTEAANLSSRRGRLKKPMQRVKNMNKTSIMIHLIEQERTTTPHCEDTVAPGTISLR